MFDGIGIVVWRLRERREEIVREIFARVCEAVPDATGERDTEYVEGLRAAVSAAVDFGLADIERGQASSSVAVPAVASEQARRAARAGVSLDAVLRRYILGHTLLWDYVMEEAERVGQDGALREMSRLQAGVLHRFVQEVTRAYGAELGRAGRSREQRRAERVRALLDGAGAGDRVDPELGYDLGAEHVGVIARGEGAVQTLRGLARTLDRRLLCAAQGEGTIWAWLGGRCGIEMAALERALSGDSRAGVAFAVGEPARGYQGWRLTHRQAQAALVVALRRPRLLTRYADVALLATALKDEVLARALVEIFLAPLRDGRGNGNGGGGGAVLLQTLRAYLAADCNVSSAAPALGVKRKTVENRLHTIEELLGRTLHPCPAEIEVALELEEIGDMPTFVQEGGSFEQ